MHFVDATLHNLLLLTQFTHVIYMYLINTTYLNFTLHCNLLCDIQIVVSCIVTKDYTVELSTNRITAFDVAI
jgi:hypothetical protein